PVHLHVDGDADGVGKTERVGRAVALDRDPAQPEKNRTVVPARITAHPELAEGAAGKQVTDPRREGVTERGLEKFPEKFGHPFRRLDGNITGEPVGDDDIDGAGRDIVSFDKAVKVDRRYS